jgi:hypothetical protein
MSWKPEPLWFRLLALVLYWLLVAVFLAECLVVVSAF